jgi:redox-sensitive bicupin YhaK (pirin superfamily)
MSAGRGVMHSEFNHSAQGQTHFLQIWIEPAVRGIDPGYEQKHFEPEQKRGRLRLVASREGADGSVTVHADARMYAGCFDAGQSAQMVLGPARKAYVQVLRGSVQANGHALATGDALLMQGESGLVLDQAKDSEVLVFDLQFEGVIKRWFKSMPMASIRLKRLCVSYTQRTRLAPTWSLGVASSVIKIR